VGMSRHVMYKMRLKKVCFEFVSKGRETIRVPNVDWKRVPDIWSGDSECSLSCLGARPGDEQPRSISGPQ